MQYKGSESLIHAPLKHFGQITYHDFCNSQVALVQRLSAQAHVAHVSPPINSVALSKSFQVTFHHVLLFRKMPCPSAFHRWDPIMHFGQAQHRIVNILEHKYQAQVIRQHNLGSEFTRPATLFFTDIHTNRLHLRYAKWEI